MLSAQANIAIWIQSLPNLCMILETLYYKLFKPSSSSWCTEHNLAVDAQGILAVR